MSGSDNFDLCPGCETVKYLLPVGCAHCGAKAKRCRGCWTSYVACSDKCKEAWRKSAAGAFEKPEPLRGGGGTGA